jgi:tRNA1Val (adenine37-N6)-methyltransferase
VSNPYFQFKRFIVQQENTAMKVCTDACLFGAWLAAEIERENWNVKKVLDIGAGTGLLSLMIAQKSKAEIEAVEIEAGAAQQARENFQGSAFAKRLQVFHIDIKALPHDHQFDLVISNPPFFENDLKSEDQKRNVALHGEELTFPELIAATRLQLNEKGMFAVLLSYHRTASFLNSAKNNQLFLCKQVLVKQTEKHNYFRSILLFRQEETAIETSEIIIKKEGKYSEEFIGLLKDYYLFL